MNETMRSALLRAKLAEEDVAARLEVDPKTVRRWLSGRVPYLRHRWALAQLLGLDEVDLWPQLRHEKSLPGEVTAVYQHRDLVPAGTWQQLFSSAQQEIAILAEAEFVLAVCRVLPGLLARQAEQGVQVRICIAEPAVARPESLFAMQLVPAIHAAVEPGGVRVLRSGGYHSLCRADDDLLITQSIYGMPAGRGPVLSLCRGLGDMAESYLTAFEHGWSAALSAARWTNA